MCVAQLHRLWKEIADEPIAAVITKYKGPEMEKPVIRPYTPVSDVGERF